MATLLAVDGAEHGAVVAGIGPDTIVGTPAIVTSPVRTGSRAWQITPNAAAEYIAYNVANRVCTMAFYLRFATLPTADALIASFTNPSASGGLWFIQSAGQLQVSVSASNQNDTTVLQTNTWYRVVVEYDTTGNTFVIRAHINNGAEISASSGFTASDQSSVRMGVFIGGQTWTGYYDDVLVSVTDGDYEEISGWLAHRVEALIPNSDGAHNIAAAGDFDSFTTTQFSNATVNGNTFIGHRPLQRANTAEQVVRQELGGATDYMEFGVENLASGVDSPIAARAYATHVESADAGASGGEARLLLSDNTEVLTTGSLSAIDSTEDPGIVVTTRDRMTIPPAGGWDVAKVNGLKWRVGFADGDPDVNFIDLMVEVAVAVISPAIRKLRTVVTPIRW
jgi:hypothetical protein